MTNAIITLDVLPYTAKAIVSLIPEARFNIAFNDGGRFDYSGIEITNGFDVPSKEELLSKIDDLYDADVAILAATEYQKQRAAEYPSIGDQLDALFHAGVFPPEMAAQIQAVKDKYPKA